MFTNFKKALSHVSKLTMIMSGEEDSLTIVLIADPKKDGVKVQPISIKGTYAQVEEELEKALDMVFEKNDAVLSNAAIVADAVKKSAETKTKKADPKKPSASKPAPADKDMFKDKEEEPETTDEEDVDDPEETTDEEETPTPVITKLPEKTPAQKAAEKSCKDIIEKVKTTTDPDMVSFLRKQAIAACEKAKVPQEGIDKMLKVLDAAAPPPPKPAPKVEAPAAAEVQDETDDIF